MQKCNRRTFIIVIGILAVFGMALRWTGIYFEGVDYQNCLSAWYEELKAGDGLHALAQFSGDYNMFYATILLLLTKIPIPPIISIKMVSILFDYLGAAVLCRLAMRAAQPEKKYISGIFAFGLAICNPLAVINSGYLGQSEGIWVSLALLSFWLVYNQKIVRGMLVLGLALSMKLQAVFILPIILIYWFYTKKFSILHLLWIPVMIQLVCIPAIIGGSGFDIAYRQYRNMLGEYPSMYYFLPNVWTYFQGAPYYLFGKYAIAITFLALLIFAVLFVKSGRRHTTADYLEYVAWTAMTCAMLLPCMHERYDYMAELVLPVCAIFCPVLRLPAVLLILISTQCIGQSFLSWSLISPYALAAGNLLVYFYLTWHCFRKLYDAYKEREEAEVC